MQNNVFSGLFVGQNFVTLKEVDSTNTFLKLMLTKSEPVPEGTVIMAEDQVAGRGQQQSKWYSVKNESLTFSIVLYPAFLLLKDQFLLTSAISIGIYSALQPLVGTRLKMKWPNDVYIGDKKLGGVLIENQVQGEKIKSSVIGIGLNINQASFPDWVPNAISLKQILQTDYDIKYILLQICSHIERWYIKLKNGEVSQIQNAYREVLYWLDETHHFKAHQQVFEGIIKGTDAVGRLLVMHSGHVHTYNLKEIEFLNKQ
ncbi:biotin--[acetyl-CoA-carboxylase] ligase [Mucilaginibacter sp. CSA2-8R]|uniref:biotin--[acetyl-CoA-carboxylase] ligase n=1 Tax=Mucilaginibacter sp. CSA2-8R TaxID=3141542 RepID=UPI00315DB62F